MPYFEFLVERVGVMKKNPFILKGNLIYSVDKATLVSIPHGYLVCEDGCCTGAFEQLPEKFNSVPVTDYGDQLIIPGLVDLHLHAPQFTFAGMGMDMELLPWLQTYAFREESKYSDLAYAEKRYSYFAKAISSSATTRASIFSTLHVPATHLLMRIMDKTGIKALVGKVNMDRNSPDTLRETTAQSYADTEKWILECGDQYKNVKPILTPRFIPSCTNELMEDLGVLQKKYKLPVQSHLSENHAEIDWVKELHPESSCYGDAYDRYGMFGGECPTIMLPDDRKLLAEEMKRLCDDDIADLVLTTGGTGLSPRDCTPEATLDVAERQAQGIAEAMRYSSMGCGISVRFAPELLSAVRAEIEAFGLEKSVYAIYGIIMDGGQCHAQPV